MSIDFFLIGHVNMGKSTLGGHLLRKVNAIEYHREPKTFSEILDTDPSEKETKNTHESNMMKFKYENRDFALYDTPGHRGFVNSLISIIQPHMTAVFIISIVNNEFTAGMEGGQLKEQLKIIYGMGIKNLIITCNKMDKIEWDQALAIKTILPFANLVSKYGYKKENVRIVYVSGQDGNGIEMLLAKLIELNPSFPSEKDSIENIIIDEVIELLLNIEIYKSDNYDVITAGYRFNIHHNGYEIGCIIEEMKPKIIIGFGPVKMKLKLDKSLAIKNNSRFLLGNSRNIFGYGYLSS